MTIVEVESDGNCMFGSVAFVIYGDEKYKTLIRIKCMDYILANRDYFKDYIDLGKYMNIEDYCEHKKHDAIWGDDIELQAMSEIYTRPIEIFAYSDQPMRTLHEQIEGQDGSL